MPRLEVGVENRADIEIRYEDHGTGRPVVLVHEYLARAETTPASAGRSVTPN